MFNKRFRRQLFIIGLCWASYLMVDGFRLAVLGIGHLQHAAQAARNVTDE